MSAFNFSENPRRAWVREITNRAEWLAWRRHDVTASRIGVLFECHPFMTLADLVAEMRGQSTKGDTVTMRAGRWLQPAFVEALRDERPEWRVTPATTYHRLPELRLACTPDFWVDEPSGRGAGVLEGKTFAEREWERHHARLPLGYMLQCLCQLMVTDASWGAIVVLIRSSAMPLYVFDVPRHPAAEKRILDAVARFWERVDAGEFPVATPPDELEALLDDGSHRDLSNDLRLAEWLEQRERWAETRADCDRQIKRVDYEIKNRMGQASTAWLPGWALSYKSVHYQEYTVKETDRRVLHVKRTEEDENG